MAGEGWDFLTDAPLLPHPTQTTPTRGRAALTAQANKMESCTNYTVKTTTRTYPDDVYCTTCAKQPGRSPTRHERSSRPKLARDGGGLWWGHGVVDSGVIGHRATAGAADRGPPELTQRQTRGLAGQQCWTTLPMATQL